MEEVQSKQRKGQAYKSYAFMAASSFLWVSGYLYCNENNISPVELSMLRGSTLLIVSYIQCILTSKQMDARILINKRILIRHALFLLQGFAMAFSQFYLPLYLVHVMANLTIISTMILDYLIDGKIIPKRKIIWIIVIMIAITVLANRQIIQQHLTGNIPENSSKFEYKSNDPVVISLVGISLMVVMSLYGFAIKLTEKFMGSSQQLNLTFGILLLFAASLFYPYVQPKTEPQTFYLGYIFTGAVLTLSEICFVLAIKNAVQVGITFLLGNFTIIFGFLFAIFRYSETPTFLSIITCLITLVAISQVLI